VKLAAFITREKDTGMPARWRRLARAAVLYALLLAALTPAQAEPPLKIAVVLSRDVAPYREAVRGFEEVLKEAGRPYKLHEYSADGVAAARGTLVEKIRSREPDLIFTVGSAATKRITGEIHDIPIVFSMVLPSSGKQGLQELRATGPNVTGASMEIPVRTQFTKLREVLPDARRIGVLYNPEVSGPMIEEAAESARALGLEFVPLEVTSETDVLATTKTLASSVDVLWSVADSTVFSHQGLKQILLETLRNRIPFVGLSPSFVKAGALLAFSTDYRDLGRQAGEQSLRILVGEDISLIPMTVPRQLLLSINMNTAKQIQVQIRDEIRLSAEVFF
jgi:putative ABC transport system substrate-binding protein